MTLDIQWLIYALISNSVMTKSQADAILQNLPENPDIADFAQEVLDLLVLNLAEDEANMVLEQLQSLIDYATEQAETGIPPEMIGVESEGESIESNTPQEKTPKLESLGTVNVGIKFNTDNINIDDINSYEDLPDLQGAAQLSDEDAAILMITTLKSLRKLGASDLHISANAKPFVRRKLQLERFAEYVLSAEDAEKLNMSLLTKEQQIQFKENLDMSMAIEVGEERFRVAIMAHKDGLEGSYRLIPDHICTLEELGFMDADIVHIKRLLDYHNGLILVTGPLNSGKTTTLGALVNIINNKRDDHVITVEDPIEILQWSKNCQVTQREIGKHTISYRTALKAALREDPDVIVIGEMHDLETIGNAITASETGHLVIGTLHTSDAANTLNRMLDVFPPSQQPQIRAMTAGSLRGIICQKLIPASNGNLTIAYEILINNMAVSNIINEGKTFRLKSTMQTGSKQGMCILDQCLLQKYINDEIDYEVALSHMKDPTSIKQLQQEWAIRQARALNVGNN